MTSVVCTAQCASPPGADRNIDLAPPRVAKACASKRMLTPNLAASPPSNFSSCPTPPHPPLTPPSPPSYPPVLLYAILDITAKGVLGFVLLANHGVIESATATIRNVGVEPSLGANLLS